MGKLQNSISIIANIITIITLLWAIIWSIYNKKRNPIGLKINVFLVTLLRITIILIIGGLYFRLWDIIYGLFLLLFNGSYNISNYYWNDSRVLFYILSYLTSGLIMLVIFWLTVTIIWTSSFEHVIDFINIIIPPKIRIKKKDKNKLIIVEAKYGIEDKYIDVTDKLNQMIVNNKLNIIASNDLAGDPIFGKVKELRIKYKINEYEIKEEIVKERESVLIELKK